MKTLALALLVLPFGAAVASSGPAPIDYARQVKPLLAERCFSCHGALKQEGGLRLDTGWLIRKGGASGKAAVAGRSAESPLIRRIADPDPVTRMPPEGEPLKPNQVALLRAWIDQGARSPLSEKAEEDPRRHWSFRRPKAPQTPRFPVGSRAAKWIRNPIDAFVAAAHVKHGVEPSVEAHKEVLLRRVYIDLIGLPPTRAELLAFLADRSPDAYEKVVDRLLASPRYGERWARHWMDVWRYSDWYGRRAQDDVRNSYGQMWRWRDWIVRSLNQDKGYDRMVVEMLAADEVAPEDLEALPATGYLVRNWYSLNYNQWMRDNVEHTGKAFLGLTLNCAHCHDHKYDPLSQKEYFQFRAFFEPLELRHERVPGEPDPGLFPKYVYGGSTPVLKTGMVRVFDEKLDAQTFMYERGDERNRMEGVPPVAPGVPALLGGATLQIRPVHLPVAAHYPGLKPFIREEELARREKAVAAARGALDVAAVGDRKLAEGRLAAAEGDLAALKARIAADEVRFGRATGDAEALARKAARAERTAALRVAEARLLTVEADLATATAKGDTAAGQKAQQQVTAARAAVEAANKALQTTDAKYTPLSPIYPRQSTGRRTALARWIASPENPLTGRVAVNHIWRYHFGKPLVETVFDFGRNGKRPTHPELLDFLASVFSASSERMGEGKDVGKGEPVSPSDVRFSHSQRQTGMGWSMKKLHRLIVTSSTYRMASGPVRADDVRLSRDRENQYLWRYNSRRVEAEVVRDGMLWASGSLDLTLGGPELDNRQETTPRRSLYYSVFAEDGGHMRLLATFDAPDPCDSYRRTESILPQQALALTNSRLALDQGRLLARKLWATLPGELGGDTVRFRVYTDMLFEQLLTRRPSTPEMQACLDFLQRQVRLFRDQEPPKGASAGVPPSADPVVRAAESLAQALFSHNDFLTLR